MKRLGALAAILLFGGGCQGGTYFIGTDCLGSGTGETLQAAIDTAAHDPRMTVLLCPRAEITLDGPLTLRQGLKLLTAGQPTDPAEMATIRLGASFPTTTGAVRGSGSDITLSAVRFDGNRRVIGPRDDQPLVELGPGDGYVVDGCAFTDAPGWTHFHILEPCQGSTVTNNVVESAVRPHDDTGHWTDGLSISCSHTLIAGNRVNDASAVGIVYFGGPGSTIRDNVVTETTTSAFSGINVGDAIVPDNTGVVVEGNQLVAVGPRYFHTAIAAGLHILGKTTAVSDVAVRNNTISGMARYGLAVDGCLSCTLSGNTFAGWQPLPPLAACPASSAYVAAKTLGGATGTLQPGFVDAKLTGCEGEAEVLGDIYRMYAGMDTYPDYLAFEVQDFSLHLQQQLDATALLRTEWDAISARAKVICPAGTASDLQTVWRRLVAAQYGDKLPPPDADARVRADLSASAPGTPCGG